MVSKDLFDNALEDIQLLCHVNRNERGNYRHADATGRFSLKITFIFVKVNL